MRHSLPILAFLACLALSLPADARPYGYMQRLQNDLADRYDLSRYRDRDELAAAIKAGRLVRVGSTDAYVFDKTFGEKDPDHRDLYAHARPYTKAFLDDVLGAAHGKFGTRYVITSLVRTQDYQNLLCSARHGGKNANAICGGSGWHRSAHLTGATVDIGRLGLSEKEQDWIRARLDALWKQGKLVYIAEAGQQYCFHVMVLPPYLDGAKHPKRKTRRHQAPHKTHRRAHRHRR